MTLRRIQLSAVVIVLFTFFIVSGLAQHTVRNTAVRSAPITIDASAPPAANWTFEGCWQQNQFSSCRDIFLDPQGNYYICRDCGTTGNPTPGKCSPISSAQLATGFWCS